MKLLYLCLEMSSDSKNYFGCVVDGIFSRAHILYYEITMTLTLKIFSSALPAVDPGGGVINKVIYGEAPTGGSNPYPLICSFLPKWYPFYIPSAKLRPFLIPQV